MWALALALAILMWLWSGSSRVLVQSLAGRTAASIQVAWLAVAIALGMAALLLVVWMLLPGSHLSRGWTREVLEHAQQLSAMLVLVVGVLGFATGRRSPFPVPSAAAAKPKSGRC
jgi:hypothetical protein